MLNIDEEAVAHDEGGDDESGGTTAARATLSVQSLDEFAVTAGAATPTTDATAAAIRSPAPAFSDAVVEACSDDEFDEDDLAAMFQSSAQMRAEHARTTAATQREATLGPVAAAARRAQQPPRRQHGQQQGKDTFATLLAADASLGDSDEACGDGNDDSCGNNTAVAPKGMFAACWLALSGFTSDHFRDVLRESAGAAPEPPAPNSPRAVAVRRAVAKHLDKAGGEVWSHAARRHAASGRKAFPVHLCTDVLDALLPHILIRGACPSLPAAGWRLAVLAMLHAAAHSFEPGLAPHLDDGLATDAGVGTYERDALVELLRGDGGA